MLIGYARTSTVEQVAGLEAQEAALAATGCKLFSEQASSVAQRDQNYGDSALNCLCRIDMMAKPYGSSGTRSFSGAAASCHAAGQWSRPDLLQRRGLCALRDLLGAHCGGRRWRLG
ncbi:MAG: hypothetical protein ABIS51_05910 [Sphingomonas sp.]